MCHRHRGVNSIGTWLGSKGDVRPGTIRSRPRIYPSNIEFGKPSLSHCAPSVRLPYLRGIVEVARVRDFSIVDGSVGALDWYLGAFVGR